MEAWHAYVGGTGALGLVIGSLRWLFSQFNGKADKKKVEALDAELKGKLDRSTGRMLFKEIKEHSRDISELKENTAITRTKVEGIEGTVGRIEDKIGRALNNRR